MRHFFTKARNNIPAVPRNVIPITSANDRAALSSRMTASLREIVVVSDRNEALLRVRKRPGISNWIGTSFGNKSYPRHMTPDDFIDPKATHSTGDSTEDRPEYVRVEIFGQCIRDPDGNNFLRLRIGVSNNLQESAATTKAAEN